MARRKKARRGGSKGASAAKAAPKTDAEVTPTEAVADAAGEAVEASTGEAAEASASKAEAAAPSRPVGPGEEGNANAGLYVMAVVFGLIALAVVAASFME